VIEDSRVDHPAVAEVASGAEVAAGISVGGADHRSFGEAREMLGDRLAGTEALLLAKLEEVDSEAPSIPASWLLQPLADPERNAEEKRDCLATRLMETFRIHQSRAAFGLLYELYGSHLLQMVASRLRRYQSKADANDVLQEVYVNIYRYPHRFDASRDDAFRLWTSTIVRNTVLKHLRSLSRSGRAEVGFEDLPEPPEPLANGPLQGVLRSESQGECERVYLTYLHLYLQFYMLLSGREQRAIHLVEVEEHSYREAAADLGIKLENLKMVIFRARRKIHRSMRRVFEGLPPDVRPARAPRTRIATDTMTVKPSSKRDETRSKVSSGSKVGTGSKVLTRSGHLTSAGSGGAGSGGAGSVNGRSGKGSQEGSR
jgi:RNA polymerase sigma factor (sigma-70 family)